MEDFDLFGNVINKDPEEKKKFIISNYLDFVKNNGREPNSTDFKDFGITRSAVRHHFGNFTNLREYIHKEHSSIVNKFILTERTVFSSINTDVLDEHLKKYNRFVITTVVSGKGLNLPFYESIKNYCKVNNAKLILIPCQDVASRSSGFEYNFPVELNGESFIHKDTRINNNLFISSIRLSAKQIKPITGLHRIGQRNGSYIFASPKQFLEFVITGSQDTHPSAIMTTGAITNNNYDDDRYMSDRTSYIAENDHVFGAIVVERVNDEKFHFRQIQADHNGSFIDLAKRYSPDSVTNESVSIVLGDLHCGEHDEQVLETTLNMLDELSVENVFVHDMFSGYSISHYDSNSPHRVAQKVMSNTKNFMDEVRLGAELIVKIIDKITGKVFRVKGNHDEWFERYLERAEYVRDPTNHYDALEYARYYLEKKDPLYMAYSKFLTDEQRDNIVFLDRDDSYKIGGVELGQHGDLGLNGSKGSLMGAEKALGDCVIGHSHSAAIHRIVYRVGTLTKLKLGYNKGPSNWTHTHCLVYNNGSRQLVNIIDGDWRI